MEQDKIDNETPKISTLHHDTDHTHSFRLCDKNQDFFTSIASKIMGPYQY